MHPEAFAFVGSVVPEKAGAVLEIGAYNVNGSVRPLFAHATSYTGLDVRDGPGVDIVSDCADYDGQGAYDTVVSTEVLEHMHRPADLIQCAARALREGGMLILTCAGPNRPHHGVDGGAVGDEPYHNITLDALRHLMSGWKHVKIVHNEQAHDLYATAVRA